MKKNLIKPVSICLCAALLCGSTAVAARSLSGQTDTQEEATQAAAVTVPSDDGSDAAVKDETVYVLANADGSVQKLIVSDWLQNTLGSATLSDCSQLTDVENVKGDEGFTVSGDTQVWDANGNDIYYQGTVEKELPVDVAISFTLDGKAISAEELAGKSGKVTIRFDYTNRQTAQATIDGKTETLFVPFAVLSGTVLDDEVFTNVSVTNGKLLNDGDRIIAVGLAFPGLQENLNVDRADLDIPDYVEITADVENFQLAGTVTVATNSVFGDLDMASLDDLDGLSDAMDDLTDAMDQLLDGADQLYEGLDTLLEKSGDLTDGITQLADGAAQLQSGAGQLADGAAQVQSGAAQLADGLDTLDDNSAALNGGAQQVFTTLLSVADSQLAAAGLSVPQLTISNYAATLNNVLASLDETVIAQQAAAAAQEQVTQAVRAQEATVRASVTTAIRAQVAAQVQAAMGLTTVPAEAQAQVDAAVEAQMQTAEVQALIDQNTESQIQALIQQNLNSDEVQSQIAAAKAQAQSGAASIQALKDQLDSYSTFYTGLQTYTAGVSSAAQGAETLSSGAASLKSGADTLYDGTITLSDGVGQLADGSDALIDGIQQLRDGSKELADGLVQFNEEGVQKLVDALDGDLDGLVSRVRATVEVAKTYRSFSGISDDMDGQVKFLYRTDAIEAE